jgi:Uma2 family endonuclease
MPMAKRDRSRNVSVASPFPATLDDLMKVEGKAELIGGRIVLLGMDDRLSNRTAGRILRSLDDFAGKLYYGEAFGGGIVYAVEPPLTSNRQSFRPDASFFSSRRSSNSMGPIFGAPDFAVEVREQHECTWEAEVAMAEKRTDYFDAGALAVWDVDPIAKTIALYTPTSETTFRPGDLAHAEPVLPGWMLDVTALFAN